VNEKRNGCTINTLEVDGDLETIYEENFFSDTRVDVCTGLRRLQRSGKEEPSSAGEAR
jgi:hypothetical protein